MVLFRSREKTMEVDLFASSETEKTFYFKNQKTAVRIDSDFIRIAPKATLSNMLVQGLDGETTILLSSITAYKLKEPGTTVGYLQLIYPGAADLHRGGVSGAVKDENAITFTKDEKEQILEIKQVIEAALRQRKY